MASYSSVVFILKRTKLATLTAAPSLSLPEKSMGYEFRSKPHFSDLRHNIYILHLVVIVDFAALIGE
jgi:hypothetical protein